MTWWREWQRRWAVMATLLGFVMFGVYLAVMATEDNNDFALVAPWAVAMLIPAILSLVASGIDNDRKAKILLLSAAALYLGIGVLSIFSLGLGFLAAGGLALYAALGTPRSQS